MIEISTSAGELLLIEVPEGAKDFTGIIPGKLGYYCYFEKIDRWLLCSSEEVLPEGQWSIYCTLANNALYFPAPVDWSHEKYVQTLELLHSHLKPDDAEKRFVVLMKEKQSTIE